MFNTTVKCRECKHLIQKEDAQSVRTNVNETYFYCPEHRKPYEKVSYPFLGFVMFS